jgi:hypothetical protein
LIPEGAEVAAVVAMVVVVVAHGAAQAALHKDIPYLYGM